MEKESITSLLTRLSRTNSIALSTLKLNAKILKNLELISSNGWVETTETGKLVKYILNSERS